QPLEVVPIQRFLQPEHTQTLQLARGLQRALIGPDRAWIRVGRTWLLRLVGVDQDHEFVAHRLSDRFDLRDVLLDRPIVQPQLHRLPALGAARGGVFGALLTRTQLNAARVASYSIGMTAPQAVQRLARRFADDVPQGNLHTPAAVGASEHAGVLLQVEGVRADQL